MKKNLMALMLILILCFSMTACGGGSANSSEYMTIDAVCVDDSYNEDGMGLLYVFYTVSTDDQNLEIDSSSIKITVDGVNTYESERVQDAAKYASSYYFSDYLEDVNVGTSLKVVETIKVAKADLEGGKTISLEKHQIPDASGIEFTTDSIVHYANQEEMAKAVDPSGHSAEATARADADAATVSEVKNQANGYYWSFYVNYTSYELEFYAPNIFEVRTSLGTASSGTYTVQNGYIFCTYPDTGYTIEIPYEFIDGQLNLYAADAFDVNE